MNESNDNVFGQRLANALRMRCLSQRKLCERIGFVVTANAIAKSIEIRLNQTGVSYKTLFADYLQTAHTVEVIDPFIRLPYQVYNLIDFIQRLTTAGPSFLAVASTSSSHIPSSPWAAPPKKTATAAHSLLPTQINKAHVFRIFKIRLPSIKTK